MNLPADPDLHPFIIDSFYWLFYASILNDTERYVEEPLESPLLKLALNVIVGPLRSVITYGISGLVTETADLNFEPNQQYTSNIQLTFDPSCY